MDVFQLDFLLRSHLQVVLAEAFAGGLESAFDVATHLHLGLFEGAPRKHPIRHHRLVAAALVVVVVAGYGGSQVAVRVVRSSLPPSIGAY